MIKEYSKPTMHYKIKLIDHYDNTHTFYKSTTEYLTFDTQFFRSAEIIRRHQMPPLLVQLCEKDCCRQEEQGVLLPMSK